jgi:hypothetical protein
MTILCVWLGYKMARERRAAEMGDRHNELLDRIIENIVPPPTGTFYTLHPGSRDVLSVQLGRTTAHHHFQRNTILRTGTAANVTSQNLVLNISELISKLSRLDIARQLPIHYSDGFKKLGLNPRITTNSTGGASESKATVVWTSSKNELTVVINAHVADDQPTAEVEILLIDSQQLRLW